MYDIMDWCSKLYPLSVFTYDMCLFESSGVIKFLSLINYDKTWVHKYRVSIITWAEKVLGESEERTGMIKEIFCKCLLLSLRVLWVGSLMGKHLKEVV